MNEQDEQKMSDSVSKWFMTNSWEEPKKDPIVDIVVAKMKARSKEGIEKYGTTLMDSPDGFYSFLNHLQEELMDAILYIEKIKTQK